MKTVVDRLGRQDAQILRLGGQTIRGHTVKVMVLEPEGDAPLPGLGEIRARILSRLHDVPRFRRRVMGTPFGIAPPVWVDDPDFAIQRHVTEIVRAGTVDLGALCVVTAQRMSERLDRRHPLWHLDVVRGTDSDRMALIWRVHHALADGTSCVRIASTLLWDGADTLAAGIPPWAPKAPPGRLALLGSGIGDRVSGWGRRRPPSARALKELEQLRGVMRRELRRDATVTSLAGRASPRRAVAFASLPLEACHDAGKAITPTATVNDVVLATIAGGIRAWTADRLRGTETIRVKVPVSLHSAAGDDLGNHDSYFFTELPVHEADPVERVRKVCGETSESKLHHDAEALYHLGLHPAFAHVAMSPRVFTFNVSNVPGPPERVTMLGARIAALYTLAEIAEHHTLRIAVISLSGRLFFGFNADAYAVTGIPRLAAAVERAGEELFRALALAPAVESGAVGQAGIT